MTSIDAYYPGTDAVTPAFAASDTAYSRCVLALHTAALHELPCTTIYIKSTYSHIHTHVGLEGS
jgi:hypothetical protein